MNFIVGFPKSWSRLTITDKGIWIFCAINTIAILTLLKFVVFGK